MLILKVVSLNWSRRHIAHYIGGLSIAQGRLLLVIPVAMQLNWEFLVLLQQESCPAVATCCQKCEVSPVLLIYNVWFCLLSDCGSEGLIWSIKKKVSSCVYAVQQGTRARKVFKLLAHGYNPGVPNILGLFSVTVFGKWQTGTANDFLNILLVKRIRNIDTRYDIDFSIFTRQPIFVFFPRGTTRYSTVFLFHGIIRSGIWYLVSVITRHRQPVYPSVARTYGGTVSRTSPKNWNLKAKRHATPHGSYVQSNCP